jgi:hypothetical protein
MPECRANIPADNANKGESPPRLLLRRLESSERSSPSRAVQGKSTGNRLRW